MDWCAVGIWVPTIFLFLKRNDAIVVQLVYESLWSPSNCKLVGDSGCLGLSAFQTSKYVRALETLAKLCSNYISADEWWRLAPLFILLSCFIYLFVSWSLVLCFVFRSLEFSVAGWRSVNLAVHFLNYENGDFLILMRDILTCNRM
jgi:hypothetical protein